jgi:hypothetical protein
MHLKKEAQAWIDKAVGETTFTYTDLYRYWRGWVDRGMPYTWAAKGSATFDREPGRATVKIRPGTAVIMPQFDTGGLGRYHTGIGLDGYYLPPATDGELWRGSCAGVAYMGMTP